MMTTARPAPWLSFFAILLFAAPASMDLHADDSPDSVASTDEQEVLDVFDAIDQGVIEATFIARNSERGRLILTNLSDQPVNVLVPDAFAGVPVLPQMGMGGMGGMGGGMMGGMGGGMQGVGGGMGGGRGGGGRGGGRGGGGRGGGARFNIAPEQVNRIDVPLVCLDHGLREPSTNKPYEIRPLEDVVQDAATIEIIRAYAHGELPFAVTQAAIWHTNSQVDWGTLASKLTGTERNMHREPYFTPAQLQAAMTAVNYVQALTAGQEVEPRNWVPVSQRNDPSSEEQGEVTEEFPDSYDAELDGGL